MGEGYGSADTSKKDAIMHTKQDINFANAKPYSQKKSIKLLFKK